jgi:DNA repair/transcription protein MET18/MMS19
MEEYKEQVLSAFISGLKGPPATRLPALAGLLQLVETAGLLEREEMGYVVHSIDELLIPGVEEVDELRLVVYSPFAPFL